MTQVKQQITDTNRMSQIDQMVDSIFEKHFTGSWKKYMNYNAKTTLKGAGTVEIWK